MGSRQGIVAGVAVLAACLAAVPAGMAAPQGSRSAQLARELLGMINAARANPEYRAETGGRAAPLRWNAAVARVALEHSEEMARAHRLSHTGAEGRSPAQRMRAAGIAWSIVAENVAMAPSIAEAQRMMMAEPPFQVNHRGNILNRQLTEVGIGIVASGDELWVTEDFLRGPTTRSAPR